MNPLPTRSISLTILALLVPISIIGRAQSPGDRFLPAPKTNLSRQTSDIPATLRPVLYRLLASEAGSDNRIDQNGSASLPGSSLRVSFSAGGARFSGADTSPVNLYLAAFGRGSTLRPLNPVAPQINGARVNYEHGDLSEWWQVLPIGYEHGFTIAKPPAGTGLLSFALSANQTPEANGEGLSWGKLHYSDLVVTDAAGKVMPATLKADGDRVLIAVNDSRATYPLTVDPLVWIEQKVTAPDGQADDLFGFRVLVSGNTAVISAPAPIYRPGAVYIFANSNGAWTETQKIIATPDVTPPPNWSDFLGWSLSLSGDTLLVGAPFTFGNQGPIGAAFVFTNSGGTWSQAQELIASDAVAIDYFGQAVGLVGDTAVIGAYNHNGGEGAAYVFTNSGGTWSQSQEFFAGDGTGGDGHQFGSSVAFDGTTIVVGAPGPDYTSTGVYPQGAAYVFGNSGGTWSQTQKLTGSDGADGDQFGFSLDLSGNTSLIGAPAANIGSNLHQGAAYVFDNSSGSWLQTQKLTASDGLPYDQFGQSVAVVGDMALVGEWSHDDDPNHPPPPPKKGASYLFTRSGGTWSEEQEFMASDGELGDSFGWDVALDGITLLIGAQGTVNGNMYQGAAYFYHQSGGLQLISASSKIGPFEIDLPLTGNAGVECRSGGPNRHYTLIFTFNNTVSSVDQASTTCGEVNGISVYGNDPHRVIVSLTGVTCNSQYVTVTLTGVHDDQGNTLASAAATMGLLLGDTNGDGVVNTIDLHQTRLERGQKTNSDNFREDVNVSGSINAPDVNLVKSQLGTMLPP